MLEHTCPTSLEQPATTARTAVSKESPIFYILMNCFYISGSLFTFSLFEKHLKPDLNHKATTLGKQSDCVITARFKGRSVFIESNPLIKHHMTGARHMMSPDMSL